jgi:hypothetical protein
MSSNGALTAGRQNANNALFPYETDDRLHLAGHTGPLTIFRFPDGTVWQPFAADYDNPYKIQRNLYKRLTGDAVMFEEINETLGLAFSYRWETSEKYGIVRTAKIENQSEKDVSTRMLDGVENILPYGIPLSLAQGSNCLTDAYKACERPDLYGKLAIYSLTSTIVDSPEPVEVLRANVAWLIGSAEARLLSSRQISAFVSGGELTDETNSTGRKGAFLIYRPVALAPSEEISWVIVMDAGLTQKRITELLNLVTNGKPDDIRHLVNADIENGKEELKLIVAAADGFQKTAEKRADARHYMNVLYNNMRGGVFLDGYDYDPGLFRSFVHSRNKPLLERRLDFFEKLPLNILKLYEKAYADGDADIIRLCFEYLPLTFSRRHGDPSRPWNWFNIQVKDETWQRLYHYEGNWRDIFQNWEAMALSYPRYLRGIIVKFLNASTADGFNPYRITDEGIDWEVPEPHNPFSGYG